MDRVIAVAVACAIVASSQLPLMRPAVGQKIDNFLNHNLPFAQLEYSCDFDVSESRPGPYGQYITESWQESCYNYVEFEFYDEMDASEKVAADSNQQFTNLFSSVGSWVASTAIGIVASKAGARVGPAIANSTSGQVASGVFGSMINDMTGWGSSAGNW